MNALTNSDSSRIAYQIQMIGQIFKKPSTSEKIQFQMNGEWNFHQYLEHANALEKINSFVMRLLISNSENAQIYLYLYKFTPDIFKDSVFYIQSMKVARRLGLSFIYEKQAYLDAKESQKTSSWLYDCYIVGCKERKLFNETQSALQEAEEKGEVDDWVYASYLKVCYQTDHFDQMQQAFERSKERGANSERTYASYIIGCGEAGWFEEAKSAYEEAIEILKSSEQVKTSYLKCVGSRQQLRVKYFGGLVSNDGPRN